MKKLLKLIAGTVTLVCLSTACSETPISPVSSTPADNSAAGNSDNRGNIQLMSLTYKGTDFNSRACQIYLTVAEDHEGEEHNHEILSKVGYKIHGLSLLDTSVAFKNYNLSTNTYSDIDSADPNANATLVSAVLNTEDKEVDYNKLLDYERTGQLVQSLRIDFNDIDHDTFTTALEEVIEDSSLLETNKPVLNNIKSTVMKIFHNGHYDSSVCINLELTEIKSIEYVISEEHDDHSDDDHGDHDDHDDHGDHDEDDHDDHRDHDEDDHGDHDDHDHGDH